MNVRNSIYWQKKNEKATKAKAHTEFVDLKYKEEIKNSIKNTLTYTGSISGLPDTVNNSVPNIIVDEVDSVSAILKYAATGEKTAVLNFASYKNPGGMFIEGSTAQEECLCHESFLYNVLKEFPDYYAYNNARKNRSLYTNRALYSPQVIFERDITCVSCDVITCAAPNFSAASEYCKVSRAENSKVLRDRIKFVLDIAEANKVEILILGAYGAGVFGQDASEVATIFKEYLTSGRYSFKTVSFAIIPGPNVEPFTKIFNE